MVSSRPALELHLVHHRLAGQVAPDLACDQAVAALPHARHRAAGVRRYQHAGRAPQRMALTRQSSVSSIHAWLAMKRAAQVILRNELCAWIMAKPLSRRMTFEKPSS